MADAIQSGSLRIALSEELIFGRAAYHIRCPLMDRRASPLLAKPLATIRLRTRKSAAKAAALMRKMRRTIAGVKFDRPFALIAEIA